MQNIPQQSWSLTYSSQSIYRNAFAANRAPEQPAQFVRVSGQLPTGLGISNTGVITGNVLITHPRLSEPITEFVYTLAIADNTVANLSQSIANIATSAGINLAGSANVANVFATVTNLSSLTAAEGNIGFQTFNTSVVLDEPYYNYNNYENTILLGNSYRYYITNTLQATAGLQWTLASGFLPPNAVLDPIGTISVDFGQSIKQFRSQHFISNTAPDTETLEPAYWQQWLSDFFTVPQERDYQFVVELVDGTGLVHTAHTIRISHFRPPAWSNWFVVNAAYLSYDPNQWYFYISSTQKSEIEYISDPGHLGNIINGQPSQLSITTVSSSDTFITFHPYTTNRFPYGLKIQDDGLIIGRVSFRCHVDDPANIPVNDVYNFTTRVYGENFRTYADRAFSITVDRINTQPVDNIWISAYPYINQRLFLFDILSNPEIFPPEVLYRPTDPWHGQADKIRMLLAPGLNILNPAEYEQVLANNHSTKQLLFGETKTAVCLDQNLNVEYEVVYLTIVDDQTVTDIMSKNYGISLPESIDLRPYITNYYVENGQSYYILEPNSIENMRKIVTSRVGMINSGMIPKWMSSIQPIKNRPGVFLPPLGLIPAVVLAYCQPGKSSVILNNIKHINFNEINFEFDRYQLENRLSKYYNKSTSSYLSANTITIDNGTTTFDSGQTSIADNYDHYADPEYDDKYLKFPKFRNFR